MENVEAKNEIFRDIVEMLEMHWLVGEPRRINCYDSLNQKLAISQSWL